VRERHAGDCRLIGFTHLHGHRDGGGRLGRSRRAQTGACGDARQLRTTLPRSRRQGILARSRERVVGRGRQDHANAGCGLRTSARRCNQAASSRCLFSEGTNQRGGSRWPSCDGIRSPRSTECSTS
jgi:hypothetical protein